MSRLKSAKKAAEKVIHSTPLHVWVSAGLASPGPPLGPQLGQRGINIAQFCKDFNERTKDYRMGVPIPCTISLNVSLIFDSHNQYINLTNELMMLFFFSLTEVTIFTYINLLSHTLFVKHQEQNEEP
jgi:hypothetical protein